MNTRIFLIILVVWVVHLCQPVEFPKVCLAQESTSVKTYCYKTTAQGELSMTVYLPSAGKEKRPAIIFFFGGGWQKGTIKQIEPQARHFADRGLVAICADYRVKSRHDVAPDACVEDAKSAVRWVRGHAEMLNVDVDRIIGAGGSAGGHLAACAALCDGLDRKDEDLSISSKPNVLVLFNPVLNLSDSRHRKLLGDNEELARAISPTLHLRSDSPPTLLFYGSEDRYLEHGREFVSRSKALQHRAELFVADGEGHGFFNLSPWRERTITRADQFLQSLGYLNATGLGPQ